MNKFRAWIVEQGGAEAVAAKIMVCSRTVRLWLSGTSSPTGRVMVRLVKMGRGAFDYNDIIGCTVLKNK